MLNILNSDLSQIDKDDINAYWPMQSLPRKSQIEVMKWIESLPSHIKYILCEDPVGGGKSPLALNLSGWFSKSLGNAYILTPQKVLQKQYEDSFDKKLLHSLYGKANYHCKSKKCSCELGQEIRPLCDACPQKAAFTKVRYSPNVVLNYTLAFLLFKYVTDEKIINKRDLIVFDEAHTIETHLTEFNAIPISEYRCKQIGGVQFKAHSSMKSAIEWLNEYYIPALTNKISKTNPVVREILDSCQQNGVSPTKDELNIISLHKELLKHKEMIIDQLISRPYEEVYADYVLVNESKTSYKFKELYGKRNFMQFVEPMAERFLFMSSTILDKDQFCEDLGLDPNLAAFISLDSEFELDNRPIFYIPTAKMTYGWNDADRKKDRDDMLYKITELCNKMHENDSGVIHAGSFQIASWLVENLQSKIPHRIMHHNPGSGFTRDKILEEFQELDGVPKLLISPSVTEGLDLKDDKGRFAIFAKIPYPSLADAWVKKRQELSSSWYTRQTLIGIIQGGGRVVRSMSDWGHVYILDSSFNTLLNMSKKISPKWWKDSITKL